MPLYLILGVVGVGAYLLLSKTASAATPVATAQQYAQQIATNPSGLQPGYQGQATGPYTPAPAPAAPVYDPSTDPGPQYPSGGVVTDPNLGGVPDMSNLIQQGVQQTLAPWQSVVASGRVGQQHRRR